MSDLLNARESVLWQREKFGRVIFGIDSLYAVARTGKIPVVRVGEKKLFFPISSLEKLLSGEVSA